MNRENVSASLGKVGLSAVYVFLSEMSSLLIAGGPSSRLDAASCIRLLSVEVTMGELCGRRCHLRLRFDVLGGRCHWQCGTWSVLPFTLHTAV